MGNRFNWRSVKESSQQSLDYHAIEYATAWLVARAVSSMDEEVVTDFINDEIYIHYGAPEEIFSDEGMNLWEAIAHEYLTEIGTGHKGTGSFHLRTKRQS